MLIQDVDKQLLLQVRPRNPSKSPIIMLLDLAQLCIPNLLMMDVTSMTFDTTRTLVLCKWKWKIYFDALF